MLFLFSWLASGCSFQKPDYLKIISPAELNALIKNEDIFLLEVHTPKQRHIQTTDLFIPYNKIKKHIDNLPEDKKTAIYLYCKSGPMANAAARMLYQLGYRDLTNLKGGANAWGKAGYEFE